MLLVRISHFFARLSLVGLFLKCMISPFPVSYFCCIYVHVFFALGKYAARTLIMKALSIICPSTTLDVPNSTGKEPN